MRHGFIAIGRFALGAVFFKGGKVFGCGFRGCAGVMLEHPSDQQKERQRQCGVKIGMRAAIERFIQRHACGQEDGQRDRHIHVHPGHSNGAPGVAEKRLCREDRRRQSNRCRDQVKQIPRRICCPRPNRDGQQHDIHHRKARDAQPQNQIARDAIVAGLAALQIKGVGVIAHRGQRLHSFFCIQRPAQRNAFQRQVHACVLDTRYGIQGAFDRADAGRAFHTRHR